MITEDRIREMTKASYINGTLNTWRGTNGELALMVRELLAERIELMKLVCATADKSTSKNGSRKSSSDGE
jgi:hypothetical protein